MRRKNAVLFLILMFLIMPMKIFGRYQYHQRDIETFKNNVLNNGEERARERENTRSSSRVVNSINSYTGSSTLAQEIIFYIGAKEQSFKNELKVNRGVVYLPIIEFVNLLTVLEKNMIDIREGGKEVVVNINKNTVKMFSDKNYAEINGERVNINGNLFWEDGDFHVPADFFVRAIGYGIEQSNMRNVTTLKVFNQEREDFENFVNTKNISSKTSYMVWISKSNYRVTVFEGSENKWKHVDSFECSLGTLQKQTIVGQFEYFSKEAKWDFGYYYVGPIMRFHGPYAMHSTLLRPNGQSYDHRLKMNISKGCVRMRPVDINWMADTIPIRTKIFVTN